MTGYDGLLEAGTQNPLAGQQAFRGTGMNQRVTAQLPEAASHRFRVRFIIGTDRGGAASGWTLDDVTFTGLVAPTPLTSVVTHRGRCVNKPPVLTPSFPQVVDERTRVTLNPPAATDPNGDALTFSWRQTSGPTVVLDRDQFDAPEVKADAQLLFTVTADDGHGGTASQAMTVTVKNVNRAPVANTGPTQSVVGGQTVTLAGVASDPDENTLIVRWSQLGGPDVTLSALDALDATFVAPDVKTTTEVNLELNVSDGVVAAAPSLVTIEVKPKSACGCSAGEGGLALAALLLLGRWSARRR
jgi:hypothetical protein